MNESLNDRLAERASIYMKKNLRKDYLNDTSVNAVIQNAGVGRDVADWAMRGQWW